MPAGVLFTLFDHARCICCSDLGAHARNVLTHFQNRRFEIFAFLGDQTGVGCDTIKNTPGGHFGDVGGIGGIQEEFHPDSMPQNHKCSIFKNQFSKAFSVNCLKIEH